MSDSTAFFQEIRQLIAQDEMAAALAKMRSLLENTPKLNEVIHQSGRLADIQQQIRLGMVTHADATLTQNQIRFGVLELLAQIEEEGLPAAAIKQLVETVEQHSAAEAVKSEVAAAISIVNSKNVVVSSQITAGGNVHIGDIIYNGPAPAQAPERQLNEYLSKTLMTAVQPYSTAATRFLEKAQALPNWETHIQASNKAKEILTYSFVGIVGIQLSKLFAIGKEPYSDNVRVKFIEKCVIIAKCGLDLMVFALISQLWEAQRQQQRSFTPEQNAVLADFFDRAFEASLTEQVALLTQLQALFVGHSLPFSITDLKAFGPHLQPDAPFVKALQTLQALSERLHKGNGTAADCPPAEQALADCLGALNFLAACRMASVKRIGYWQIRTEQPRYLHRFAALGIDSKANVDAEKIDFTSETAHTDSVLLYQGERYQEGINLSPFVIDYNALTLESGAKICFFRSRSVADDSLEYCFLEDSSLVHVAWKGILQGGTDANEVLLQQENQKLYNLDNTIAQFRDARNSILGDLLNFDDL